MLLDFEGYMPFRYTLTVHKRVTEFYISELAAVVLRRATARVLTVLHFQALDAAVSRCRGDGPGLIGPCQPYHNMEALFVLSQDWQFIWSYTESTDLAYTQWLVRFASFRASRSLADTESFSGIC